jgi:GT2 family glycosyltransferase
MPFNVGFPKANNVAIRQSRGKFLLLLNPDTIVPLGTLDACLHKISQEPSIGALGCMIRYPDGTIQFECARRLPELLTFIIETPYLHMLAPNNRFFGRHLFGNWAHNTSRDVPCLMGAFMMLRRNAIEAIGLLDETFFMYYEDIDLCARMHEGGWRVHFLSDVHIIHFSGKSREKSVEPFDLLTTEIYFRFFLKHAGVVKAYAYRLIVFMQSLIRILLVLLVRPILMLAKNRNLTKPGLSLPLHVFRFVWSLGLHKVNLSTLGHSSVRRANSPVSGKEALF